MAGKGREEDLKKTGNARQLDNSIFVEFRDVVFGYDEHVVLNHVSFKVMDGDQVTLAGRTGAGKSTILKLLLGLYEPQSGEVLDPRCAGGADQRGRAPEAVRLRGADVPYGARNGAGGDHLV